MKIKEVSEKTDLTERAIRLYIENGLVAPSVDESYSGRRNIDFSDKDVEMLKNISVMRKAGFSIAQIKLMQTEPEKSKEVLQEFISDVKGRIETDKEIVACLTPLLSLEKLDAEQISRSLEKPIVEEKLLPAEDSEPSPLQKFIRKLFLFISGFGVAFGLLCNVPILWVEIRDLRSYRFPGYDVKGLFYMTIFSAAFVLPLIVILLNRKITASSKIKQRVKSVVSVVLICMCVWCSFMAFCWASLSNHNNSEGFAVSQTRNVGNYGYYDSLEAWKTLPEFLPEELPDVKGIKYKYRYKSYGREPIFPSTEVFLEIPLDSESFRKTVEKYKAFRPSDSVCEPYEETVNDWTIIYYREDYERAPTNYDPVFAFNEKERKVRFICEHGNVAIKGATSHHYVGYYKW